MDNERIAAVEAILAQTESAHGAYEASELHGVYDVAWATWYAVYAVDHGIGDALGRTVSVEELAAFLTSSWAERTASDPDSPATWAAWTAPRLAAT
jgi:hypothetical protein